MGGSVSNGYYLEVEEYSSTSDERITFYLPGIRSATYRAFIKMVPKNITSTVITEVRPNRFRAYTGLSTLNTSGNKSTVKEVQFRTPDGKANFESDPTSVSFVDLGEVTFPHCYFGLGEYRPWIRIESNPGRNDYDHTLRIDCILLVPAELYEVVPNPENVLEMLK